MTITLSTLMHDFGYMPNTDGNNSVPVFTKIYTFQQGMRNYSFTIIFDCRYTDNKEVKIYCFDGGTENYVFPNHIITRVDEILKMLNIIEKDFHLKIVSAEP